MVTMAITVLKQQPAPIAEQTVSDCPSIFMLIVSAKERTKSWDAREEDTEGKMWTSERGRHTTELRNELHGPYVSHTQHTFHRCEFKECIANLCSTNGRKITMRTKFQPENLTEMTTRKTST
jgi:hypothetical protein